jgi:hypothetical protein
MRFPGRALERDETAPEPILGYVARQLGAAGAIFDNGADRDKSGASIWPRSCAGSGIAHSTEARSSK